MCGSGGRQHLQVFQQHVNSAGAAVHLPGGYEGQHVIPLLEPAVDGFLEHRTAPARAEALAVHDADAELAVSGTTLDEGL